MVDPPFFLSAQPPFPLFSSVQQVRAGPGLPPIDQKLDSPPSLLFLNSPLQAEDIAKNNAENLLFKIRQVAHDMDWMIYYKVRERGLRLESCFLWL